jgi:hypothetical protein
MVRRRYRTAHRAVARPGPAPCWSRTTRRWWPSPGGRGGHVRRGDRRGGRWKRSTAPRHPYTRLLFAATPDLHGEEEVAPSPARRAAGPGEKRLPFHPAATYFDPCARDHPALTLVAPGHRAACHLTGLPADERARREAPGRGLGPVLDPGSSGPGRRGRAVTARRPTGPRRTRSNGPTFRCSKWRARRPTSAPGPDPGASLRPPGARGRRSQLPSPAADARLVGESGCGKTSRRRPSCG